MKQGKRTNKILIKWVMSSLLLLLIPVIFGVLIYGYALRTIRKDIDYIQYQTLYQVRESVESSLYSGSQIGLSLTHLEEVRQLKTFQEEGAYSKEQILESRKVLDDINFYRASNEMISEIILYFPKTDYILKGGKFCSLDWLEGWEESELYMPLAEVRRLATRKENGVHSLENGQGLVYSYSDDQYGEQTSVLVLLYYNMNQINKLVERSDSSVFLLFADGGCYSTDGSRPDDKITDEGEFVLLQTGERYLLQFLNVISKEVYLEKIHHMTLVLIGYVIVCLVFGSGIAWYISRRNYQPISELVDLLPKNYQEKAEGNDFQVIRQAYQKLLEENKSKSEDLRDSVLAGINTWMNEVLKGRSQGVSTLMGREAKWGKELTLACFAVISGEIVEIEKLVEDLSEAETDILDMAYFIVQNVLQELLSQEYRSVEGETEGILFSVVNIDEHYDQTLVLQRLKEICQNTSDYVKKQFGIRVSFSISDIHREREGIRQCYHNLEEVWNFRTYQGISEEAVVCHTEFRLEEMDRFEEYQKLCDQIQYELRIRRISEAEKLIKNLKAVKRQLSRFAPLPDMPEAEIAKAAGSTEVPGVAEVPENAVKEQDEEQETELRSQSDREIYLLMDQVVAYIDKHYTNNMLSASFLADEFHIGLSYLSRAFKERTGTGVLNYINEKRLILAKRLLTEEDMAVKDVAEKVGFFTTQPLIRLFRQSEGMTPKEYQNSIKKENEGN